MKEFHFGNLFKHKYKLLICLIVLFGILISNTHQQETKEAAKNDFDFELPDEELDPEDIAEYEAQLKKKKELSITTTTTAEPEPTARSILDAVSTTPAIDDYPDTSAESTQTLSTKSIKEEALSSTRRIRILPEFSNKLNKGAVSAQNLIEVKATSFELKLEKSEEKNDIVYYSIKRADLNFQTKFSLKSEQPIDFRQCAISFNQTEPECIKSYIEILSRDFVLKINKSLLPGKVTLSLILVMSGCDSNTRIRDANLVDNMPMIYHNSDHDCIYRIKKTITTSMLSVMINNFPSKYEKMCKTLVQISNSANKTDDGELQASFENYESIMPFAQGVFVSQRYALIKVVNCYENNEPVEIKLNLIKRNAVSSSLGDKEKSKYFYRLDSVLLASPKIDSILLFEMVNEDSRNTIVGRLSEYSFLTKKQECIDETAHNTSMITIYGIDQYNRMFVQQYTPCQYEPKAVKPIEFRGFKKIYIQFYRDPFDEKLKRKVDEFVMEFNLKLVQKYFQTFTRRAEALSSKDLQNLDLRNHHLDFEIIVPLGYRIIFTLETFNNSIQHKECSPEDEKCSLAKRCDDLVIIKLNRSIPRADSLYEENTNPKFCNKITKPATFSTYSNRLLVSFLFDELKKDDQQLGIPSFSFSYTSEPICNNFYTKRNNTLISYNSINSITKVDSENGDCMNTISLNRYRRIVLYRTDWLFSRSNYLTKREDEVNANFVNGRLACKNSDSLILSNYNPKYAKYSPDFANEIYNTFCMDNPFSSFVSERNSLYLNYKRVNPKVPNLSKPLVFDIGYFSYRYLFDQDDSEMSVEFAKIIPKNVNNNTRISNLEFKIKLADSKSYIFPVITDCYTHINNGLVNIRANNRAIPFKMACGNQSYTLMSSMENELTFEFSNVLLSDLRDQDIRFKINYKVLPKVLTGLNGAFESNNFKHHFVSLMRETIEYEWIIELNSNYFIKLNVESILNDINIAEFSIKDDVRNLQLYDQSEIVENYKSSNKLTYLFSTNRIRIIFKHIKDSKTKTSRYPYIKCSYSAEPRILSIGDHAQSGEIKLNNALTKNKLDWTIMAPKDHYIIVKIVKFSTLKESNGQLKFSQLSKGYSDNGIYYFNLNNNLNQKFQDKMLDAFSRSTEIVVSKDNLIQIEYLSGGKHDSFHLVYSFAKRVFSHPSGLIKPHFNNLTQPTVKVPKLTDQNWVIKAPYGKRVQVLLKFIDLLSEEPCAKASVNFFESNGTLIQSKCGHTDLELSHFDFESAHILTSETNEVGVQFVTQNSNDVIYSSNISPDTNEAVNFELYRGFTFYYAFLETPGDCYFQLRKNIFCGYENVGKSKWLVNEDQSKPRDADEMHFDKLFCSHCFLTASIPIQTELANDDPLDFSVPSSSAVFVSPVISKHRKYLKFNYKLFNSGRLLVKLVYDKEYTKKLEHSVILKEFEESEEWTTVRFKIGNQLFHNYRLVFVLERAQALGETVEILPTAMLDNIQLFERDLDCASSMDNAVCDVDDLLHNINIEKKSTQHSSVVDSKFCQKYLTPCDQNKCLNGATCLNKEEATNTISSILAKDTGDDYVCLCSYGYTGAFCEHKIDPCAASEHNKCSNNSKCFVPLSAELEGTPMHYECLCDKGYHGKYCDLKYTPCKHAKNPCNQLSEQGVCVDAATKENPNDYTCVCSPMFTGKECDIKFDEKCLDNPCNKFDEKATCVELSDRFACKCSLGFEGPLCSNIDDCKSSPCQNGGVCVDGVNSFHCECDETKYFGKYCEKSKLCSECKREGTLFCDAAKSECVCKATHQGKLCEFALDPCLNLPCGANGECVSNKIDDYKCICNAGFKGKNCDIRESECDRGFCQNGAECLVERTGNSPSGEPVCKCAEGFEGKQCEHLIKMCDKERLCKNGATCINTINNYTCICPDSFYGRHCEKHIDNCLNSKCAHNSKCHSILNSYICICPPGRYGRYCNDETDKCYNNECKNGGCVPNELENADDIQKQYKCNCLPGFTGRFCEINIDDCESSPCQHGGICIDLINSHKCKCPLGYSGKNCETSIEFCSLLETRCNPAGTVRCLPFSGGNKCECQPGYTGTRCETPIDICQYHKPCKSGKCISKNVTDYECSNCSLGFGGKNCSEIINHCELYKPCKHEGVCYPKLNGYVCQCSGKYVGVNCESVTTGACEYNKCQHNSKCVPAEKGYKCECSEDHEGTYCEKKKSSCPKTCEYGYCDNGKCECDPKILFCKKFSECNSMKCLNGGKCIDVIVANKTRAECLCPPGLTGKLCETSVLCQSKARPCGEPNQCVAVKNGYQCQCDKPYIGHKCNKRYSDYLPEYEVYLKQEKLTKEKESCKFGSSKESLYFIGIVAAVLIILTIVGFLLAHRSVRSYRRQYEAQSRLLGRDSPSSSTNEDLSNTMAFQFNPYKTPLIQQSKAAREITLQNSAGFSIPRPTVRPPVRL